MSSEDKDRKRSTLRDLIRFVMVALALAAVVKELKKPAEDRTWHGAVFNVVPYDFRKPSMDRVKATMWDPEGPVFTPRVFGVGWGINAGAIAAKVKASRGEPASA